MSTKEADPIKHVVVLMLENRSFDQMLGSLRAIYQDLDGVDPKQLHSNLVGADERYEQAKTTTLCIDPDPKHTLRNVLRQIDKLSELPTPKSPSKWRRFLEWLLASGAVLLSYVFPKPRMRALGLAAPYTGQFASDYAAEYPKSKPAERREIMGYYPVDFLAAHHALARNYTICDRWFSSVPGPTWANRFFLHSGTALGRVWMPEAKEDILKMRPYDQATLYTRLNEAKPPVSWKIYFGDIPQSFCLTRQLHRDNIRNYRPMSRFYEDAKGAEADFPEYCVIEPSYFLTTANDDHPPHNTMHAQCLTADVYNALRNNPALWESTLFVVLYDEHGGFFDHVEPPKTIAPDALTDEYTFDRLGVRVPALLVSPWVEAGVLSTQFDHASLLKYLTEKWDLGPLGQRVAKARSIREAIKDLGNPRLTLPKIEDTPEMQAARQEIGQPDADLNGHQRALLLLSKVLAALLDTPVLPTILRARAAGGTGSAAADEIEGAKEVIRLLIEQGEQNEPSRL